MKGETPHRSYLTTVFGCWCPRCREGKLFTNSLSLGLRRNLEMPDECTVCGQPTDIEVGFYYGTGYISYFIALILSAASLLLWWLVIGFSYKDYRFAAWAVTNSLALLALQPWLMRFSRSLWLSFFVEYDPDWRHSKPRRLERVNKDQMTNW